MFLGGGCTGYFVLGYFLFNTEINIYIRKIIYFFGVFGAILTLTLTNKASLLQGALVTEYYGVTRVNNLLMALALFVWFKYNCNGESSMKIRNISKYCLGIYLVHAMFLSILPTPKPESLTNVVSILLAVPAIALTVFLLSIAVSFILNHIPKINKYIV